MRFAAFGRTRILLDSIRLLIARGHTLTCIATSKTSSYCGTTFEEFDQFAKDHHVPLILGSALDHSLGVLNYTHSDVAISVNWPTLIKEPLLSTFKHGILNAHAGDLPRFRGNAVANWAILNGESQIGLTIHRMVAELDAGPIYLKSCFPLSDQSYIGDVYAWIEQETPELFARTLDALQSGTAVPHEQSTAGIIPLRAFPRKPEDSRIDWLQSSDQIHCLLRASSRPFSGAYAVTENSERVTIWRADIFIPPYEFLAIPGQICFAEEDDPVIACGSGMIRLTEVTDSHGQDARPMILSSLRNRLL
jgi:methionyl-tRNA formyltransferase